MRGLLMNVIWRLTLPGDALHTLHDHTTVVHSLVPTESCSLWWSLAAGMVSEIIVAMVRGGLGGRRQGLNTRLSACAAAASSWAWPK